MSKETNGRGDSTRREYIRYGGAVAAGGLLAGCTGRDSPSEPTDTDATSPTETGESTDAGDTYSASIEPVGSVEFENPPETWFPYTGDYADMGVALGRGDGLAAIGVRRRFGTHHYEELPGVSVDKSELTQLYQDGTDKEVFFELDADVHVIDPNFMINRLGWSQDDVD